MYKARYLLIEIFAFASFESISKRGGFSMPILKALKTMGYSKVICKINAVLSITGQHECTENSRNAGQILEYTSSDMPLVGCGWHWRQPLNRLQVPLYVKKHCSSLVSRWWRGLKALDSGASKFLPICWIWWPYITNSGMMQWSLNVLHRSLLSSQLIMAETQAW